MPLLRGYLMVHFSFCIYPYIFYLQNAIYPFVYKFKRANNSDVSVPVPFILDLLLVSPQPRAGRRGNFHRC